MLLSLFLSPRAAPRFFALPLGPPSPRSSACARDFAGRLTGGSIGRLWGWVALTACVAFEADGHAATHDPGLSMARIRHGAESTRIELTVHLEDFRSLRASHSESPADDTIRDAASLFQSLIVVSTDQTAVQPLHVTWGRPEPDDVHFVADFGLPAPATTVQFPMLDHVPFGHKLAWSVEDIEGRLVDHRLLGENQTLSFAIDAPAGSSHGDGYIYLGVEHILLGFDHLVFLGALLFASRRLRGTLAHVTGFTVAHSAGLIAASAGFASPPSSLIEPLIAASIVWVAALNVLPSSSTRGRLAVTATCGVAHGFGFHGALDGALDTLPGSALWSALAQFNLGIEIGQLALVALAFPALWWIGRSERRASWARIGGSLVTGACGLAWLVERTVMA